MFTYSEHVLKVCIAQLAKYVGFKSINELAFEILIDLLSRFIINFGKLSATYANQCNRTQVNLDDICFVLKSLGLHLDDLIDYLNEVKLPFAGAPLPSYPVLSKTNIVQRIQFPTQSECESRKEFYQDWQPTLISSSSSEQQFSINQPDPQQQLIDSRLEELDLIDYIEQQRKLKITEDKQLNRRLLNRIRDRVNELNIGGFTELEAQVPNYIYLSADGQALSFGNREGRLPEARQHGQILPSSNKLKIQLNQRKSSKLSKRLFNKRRSGKKRSKQQSTGQSIEKSISRSSEQSEEQIVSDLLNEMISSVEDKFNESFYDDNEAAKTLMLLSYDSSKSVLSSTAESPSIDEDENQIDYSPTKFNYDLNNNIYTTDSNNNIIDQRKENGYIFNNLINGKLDKNHLIDYQSKLNDVKNLTIAEDDQHHLDDSNKKLNNSKNNLPKLKFKLTFDKYKESLANSNEIINNHVTNDHHLINSTSTTNHKSSSKHQDPQTTKDKQRKKHSKKSNSIDTSTNGKIKKEITPLNSSLTTTTTKSTNSKKSKNNQNSTDDIYYCPTCNQPDDGTPMIGCDKCDNWYHYFCQNVFVKPKEEQWFCLNCSVQQSLDEAKRAKKLKKLKELDKSSASDKNSKKRTKQMQKQEDKKTSKKKSSEEDIYYCPSCSKPDDGSPMVGCDKCDNWHHYSCVGLKNTPPKDQKWYCPDCKNKKKLKKLKK